MFSDLKTFRRRAKQIVFQKTGLASESVHVDFNAYVDRHLETERQLKEVKKSIEALSEGLLRVTQATTSTSSTFSSVYAKNEDDSGGLTKKYADCAVQLEERSRSKAEQILAEQVTALSNMLSQIDKIKFDNRKALLLDLDAYKRKVADLKEKEQKNPGKVDQAIVRDKENKLKLAEQKFTECNDELMEEMAHINDMKPELLERVLLGSMKATHEFFSSAGVAMQGMDAIVKEMGGGDMRAQVQRNNYAQPQQQQQQQQYHQEVTSPAAKNVSRTPVQDVSPVIHQQQQYNSQPMYGSSSDPFASSPAAMHASVSRRLASFDYAATEPGELTFTKGDYITVIEEDPSGWWQGRNERTGQTGVFPSNYTAPA